MGLEEDIQRMVDMGVQATPAAIRAYTEGPQEVPDPIAELILPMMAAHREAMLRMAREIDSLRD